MTAEPGAWSVSVYDRIRDIPAAAWDACANPQGLPFNPFIAHAFLSALEESGSATAEKGWAPRHLALTDERGEVAAVMPCYAKSHSYGEFVFDYPFAEAYERAGGRYYPKLQTAVPFTPVTGRRLLVRPGVDAEQARALLSSAAVELVKASDASSWHVTFASRDEWASLGGFGLLQRTDTQYHWHNRDYTSFDDFLASLASRKRKAVRKEREQARASGIAFEWLTGSAIKEAHWDAFFAFYMDTGSRKWGRPYLTRAFFSLIGEAMADRILLVMAMRHGEPIAGALNFIGGDTLYGRYWGCLESHTFLHFEACYYQAIDFAIARKLAHVEAGAQGEHKLARGYAPETTYSLHYFASPGLARAAKRFLEQEREAVAQEQEALSEALPYRRCE
ncbi:GNAT family N-acetyltransferase [Rhodomicrobium lacus]|uniref:GNAT family N-acetyltransferase n=1 Tax=Rhodomicrobium lacus TaxID=2498452 RepID=UPI000F8E7705|nr:GNAT family N-acetyltransferase [Rhodomicrobium lacus]